MRTTLLPRLNIRRKVTLGLAACLLAMGAIAWVSYSNLMEIERKVHLIHGAADLSNVILEIRRYEKNYFLYGHDEDLEEANRFIREAAPLMDEIAPMALTLKADKYLSPLRNDLAAYARLLDTVSRDRPADRGPHVEALRDLGKRMVDTSHQFVGFERQRILTINQELRASLLASIALLLSVGLVLVYFINRQVIRPLRVIEDTTRRIAKGRFDTIPVVRDGARDEVTRVMEAFNRMVVELERRQDQLVQARKLSSIGTLSSGIAHQLNNPLNNIYTSCQILRSEYGQALDGYGVRLMDNIDGETFRARDIVRGLLEFSRQQEFSLRPASLHEVVERSIRLISSQVPAGIKITADVPEGLVLGLDKQRMQEVFLNLFMNAVQAIEVRPGQIHVSATADAPDSEDGSVVVTVSDTGKGIPEAIRGQIFDPFYTSKEVGVGTGLGLFIVYGIIQKHGGSIAVDSQEGHGTRFTIRLPAAPGEGAGEDGPPLPAEAGDTTGQPRPGGGPA